MPSGLRRLAVLVVLLVAGCSSASNTSTGGSASGGGSSSQGADTKNSTAVRAFLSYSGSYKEDLAYTASSQFGSDQVTKHIDFTFRESVSLTTPKSVISRAPAFTSAVSTSLDRPVYFSDSGTITYQDTPHSGGDCTASLSGVSGISDWQTTGAIPPVEIDVAAVSSSGARAKQYALQISAALPAFGGRVVKSSSTANDCYTAGLLGNLTNSPAIYGDPTFLGLVRPGPRELPFLVLPLNSDNYSKHYKFTKTAPYTGPGISGTDTVDADTTITVNPTLHLYAALGDSYSSGAFPELLPGGCSRSKQAYPELYDPNGIIFLACSGESTLQITNDQVSGIPPNAKVVSLTAGGDDFQVEGEGAQGLFGLLIDCVLYNMFTAGAVSCRSATGLNNIGAQLATIQANVEALIAAIHKQADQARIYVLGYPNPLPGQYTGYCSGLQSFQVPLPGGGVAAAPGISSHDVGFLSNIVDTLNNTLRLAVSSSGQATFVAPFSGHDVCSDTPWFTVLGVPAASYALKGQPLHPNQLGHQAMADALRAAAGAPPP